MKKIFVILLCCSTLLYGCYPYSPLTREELIAQNLNPKKDLTVTLVDGSVIKSQPYHHIFTTELADFIYGTGIRKSHSIRVGQSTFVGKLQRASIDSLKFIGSSANRYLVCYLKDSTDVYYRDGDYIILTPDQPPGLWCAGIHTIDGKESVFNGRIPDERIKSVKAKKFNAQQTFVAVTVATAAVGVIMLLIGIILLESGLNNLDL